MAAFLKKEAEVSVGKDDKLIDLKVGNPLKKITDLLEDIKRQKAFSFTLKGSLGIMGVVLSLSLLGIFGTTHMLCDKGVQTQSGVVKVLQAVEPEDTSLWGKMKRAAKYYQELFTDVQQVEEKGKQRVILYTAANAAIHIVASRGVPVEAFAGQQVFATGDYDSCTQVLKVKSPQNIEVFQ